MLVFPEKFCYCTVNDILFTGVLILWNNAKKFFIFIGVFIGSNIILSFIAGLILTNLYHSDGYKGSPIIGTLINVVAAVLAVFVAYKPLKKKDQS
jgi:hypothetical protein